MALITTPKANIPIGIVTIQGREFNVTQHPEFVRFFFDLFRRVGGTSGSGSDDIESLAFDAQARDPGVKEALTAIDELRNENENLRGDVTMLRAQIEELRALIPEIRNPDDLRGRVADIEARLN